jgi:RecJ-like exonuclease
MTTRARPSPVRKAKIPWPFGHPTVECPACHGAGSNYNRLQSAWTLPTRAVDADTSDLRCSACGGRGRVIHATGVHPITGESLTPPGDA